MKISGSGRLVFGAAPPEVVCIRRLAAYVVISGRDGRVAAVRATVLGRPYFWLPGGGGHAGETPEATVLREVGEELGRLIKVTGRIGETVEFFYSSDDKCWYEMIATFFRTEFEGRPHSREQPELFFHACHAWAAAQA